MIDQSTPTIHRWHHKHMLSLCLVTGGCIAAAQPAPQEAQTAQQVELVAAPAIQWQASLGYHRYREPVMQLQGPEVGLGLRWSATPMLRVEAQWWGSTLRYDSNGTGSMSGVANHEFRGLALYRFGQAESWLPQYQVGLAGAYIYNDLRGRTTTHAVGYERISEQLWLPLRWQSGAQMLGLKAPYLLQYEVGWLLHGRQLSRLSQVGPGYADADNTQRQGVYLQLNAVRPADPASMGPYWEPYVRITRIPRSDVVPVNSGSLALEPSNTRIQLGVSRVW